MHDEAMFEEKLRGLPLFHSGVVEEALALGRERAIRLLERLMFDTGRDELPGAFAALLLGRIGGEDVVELVLRAALLADKRFDRVLGERAMNALYGLGASMVERALAVAGESTSRDLRAVLAQALVSTGIKDDRIYALCVSTLEWNPFAGAALLETYGDPLGVVDLRRVIDDFHAGRRRLDAGALQSVLAAFDALGGSITEEDLAAYSELIAPFLPKKKKKVPRNQSCPCGSGKKAKRCHPFGAAGSELN